MKRILITGICGFAGSTIAKTWLEAEPDLKIYGIDNFIRSGSERNRLTLQKLGVELYHADTRSASDLENLPAVDWLIDAAANPSVLSGINDSCTSRQLMEHNLFGAVNILEYCKKYQAGYILISTSRVYSQKELNSIPVTCIGEAFSLEGNHLPLGLSHVGVNELFSTIPPLSLYGSTKRASEILALEYGAAFDFPVWINRCGVLAGAGQFGRADQGIVSYWINSWVRHRPLSYIGYGGNGYQVRDVLHPGDIVPLLQQQTATDSAVKEQIINLGGGQANAISLAELSSWCHQRFGARDIGRVPGTQRFDIPWLVMDSSLARAIWGWSPKKTVYDILDEIAVHAEQHHDWLEISGAT